MTPLRQRMLEDMQLRGLSPKTQRCYVQAVQHFAQHYGKSPAEITEEELRQYFLYLSTVKRVSPSTVTIALCAIKFLFERTLQRPWRHCQVEVLPGELARISGILGACTQPPMLRRPTKASGFPLRSSAMPSGSTTASTSATGTSKSSSPNGAY